MQTSPKMPPRSLRVGKIVRTPSKDFVDHTVKMAFVHEGRTLPVAESLLSALIHNIESQSIWRLKRACFERVAGNDRPWKVAELVFGFRKRTDQQKGAAPTEQKASPALTQFLRSLARKAPKQATYRSIQLDLAAKQPILTASVEIVGKDYKQRFFALETSLLDTCKKPKSAFVDVRWGGGEKPIATDGKQVQGAVFTLELRIRKQ
ncbi:MAG: hypothetical protein AB8H80_17705 [Planctomycetota bacterium]